MTGVIPDNFAEEEKIDEEYKEYLKLGQEGGLGSVDEVVAGSLISNFDDWEQYKNDETDGTDDLEEVSGYNFPSNSTFEHRYDNGDNNIDVGSNVEVNNILNVPYLDLLRESLIEGNAIIDVQNMNDFYKALRILYSDTSILLKKSKINFLFEGIHFVGVFGEKKPGDLALISISTVCGGLGFSYDYDGVVELKKRRQAESRKRRSKGKKFRSIYGSYFLNLQASCLIYSKNDVYNAIRSISDSYAKYYLDQQSNHSYDKYIETVACSI